MNLAYNLSKQIPGEKILYDLNKLCNKIPKDELNSTALVISLVKIVDLETSSSPPNIEYKPEQ